MLGRSDVAHLRLRFQLWLWGCFRILNSHARFSLSLTTVFVYWHTACRSSWMDSDSRHGLSTNFDGNFHRHTLFSLKLHVAMCYGTRSLHTNTLMTFDILTSVFWYLFSLNIKQSQVCSWLVISSNQVNKTNPHIRWVSYVMYVYLLAFLLWQSGTDSGSWDVC